MKDYKGIYYPESKFGGFADVDSIIAFYIRVNSLINSSSIVLDVGCGRGSYAENPISMKRDIRIFKGKCKKVIGIDTSKEGENNPFLDEFSLIEGTHWPLEDSSIDLCISDSVLEHTENPKLFFSECYRVIKQGGYLCIRTPNIMSYFGLFSRLVPNRFHSTVLSKVQINRKDKDVFPAFYKCNTIKRIRYMLNKYDFNHCVYGYEGDPSYFAFSRFFYLLGMIHQRYVPNIFKIVIFVYARKK